MLWSYEFGRGELGGRVRGSRTVSGLLTANFLEFAFWCESRRNSLLGEGLGQMVLIDESLSFHGENQLILSPPIQ